jgi:hypothetical protein
MRSEIHGVRDVLGRRHVEGGMPAGSFARWPVGKEGGQSWASPLRPTGTCGSGTSGTVLEPDPTL